MQCSYRNLFFWYFVSYIVSFTPHLILFQEGSPGVGKTSLVAAVGIASGMKVTRINLSDQTDIIDLLGNTIRGQFLHYFRH